MANTPEPEDRVNPKKAYNDAVKEVALEALKSYLTAYLLQPSRIDINLWCASVVPDCIKISQVMVDRLNSALKS